MSEQFNNKDYSDYFSAIEKSLERKAASEQIKKDAAPVVKNKKTYGGVIRLRPWVYVAALVLVVTIITVIAIPKKTAPNIQQENIDTESVNDITQNIEKEPINLFATFDGNVAEIEPDIESSSIIVINCNTNKVVAARNAKERLNPASTTKIMTLLTAVEHINDYSQTFTFSYNVTDPLYIAEATVAGFSNEESVSLTDMFYGAILPSGADATVGIAKTVAGSEEEFVKLMNKKAEALGLKNTNFTNSSGLYDKEHYTTAEDMAVIIREAMKNELCRKVLSTYQYTTAATPQHPEGIALTSTLFSYMYGTEPEGADILGGKTGYVNESGYCIASFGKSDTGSEYVCVTLNAPSLWPAVYDQIDLYSRYAK